MKTGWFGKAWLLGGYAFLYLPIVALVIFSFNDSALPNIWRGFTLKWYAALADDSEILNGFWVSLKIAFFTACGSVVSAPSPPSRSSSTAASAVARCSRAWSTRRW